METQSNPAIIFRGRPHEQYFTKKFLEVKRNRFGYSYGGALHCSIIGFRRQAEDVLRQIQESQIDVHKP